MKNNKSYIIVFIILIVYLLSALLIFKLGLFNKNYSYIVFSDKSALRIYKKNYKFVDVDSEILSNKKFKVYDYNEYLGEYNVSFDTTYRVYDDQYNLIRFNNDFIGIYSKKNDITLNTNYSEILNFDDLNLLQKILSENGIAYGGYLTTSIKKLININGYDNVYLYNVSYDDYLDYSGDLFSVVYVCIDNDYIVVDLSFGIAEDLETKYISAIVDLDADGTDEIIIDTMVFSESQSSTKKIYKYKSGKYVQQEL